MNLHLNTYNKRERGLHLYSTTKERQKLMEDLYQKHNLSNQKIHELTYKDLVDLGFDCMLLSDYSEAYSDKKVFDLSLRSIQSYTTKMKPNTIYTIEEIKDHPKQTEDDLDTSLLRLLSEPDPELFLNSCGYRTKVMQMGNKTKNTRGFNQNTTGILYLIRFYNEDIEFLKFGITNKTDYEERTKQQLRTAKRHGLDYNYEYVYISSLQEGSKIYNTEQQIRLHTKIFDRVPKSLLPDGHTETTSMDALYLILALLDQYLGMSVLD